MCFLACCAVPRRRLRLPLRFVCSQMLPTTSASSWSEPVSVLDTLASVENDVTRRFMQEESRKVFVASLPLGVTEEDVRTAFSKCGEVCAREALDPHGAAVCRHVAVATL